MSVKLAHDEQASGERFDEWILTSEKRIIADSGREMVDRHVSPQQKHTLICFSVTSLGYCKLTLRFSLRHQNAVK